MIVVDLGCYNWGRTDSMDILIARFEPRIYWGFDPCLERELVEVRDGRTIILSRRAAWTHNGFLQLHSGGEGTKVTEGGEDVLCFDFPSFVQALPGPVVVKMDIEGAEYEILEEMVGREIMDRVSRWLIEWHGPPMNFPHETWDL